MKAAKGKWFLNFLTLPVELVGDNVSRDNPLKKKEVLVVVTSIFEQIQTLKVKDKQIKIKQMGNLLLGELYFYSLCRYKETWGEGTRIH